MMLLLIVPVLAALFGAGTATVAALAGCAGRDEVRP